MTEETRKDQPPLKAFIKHQGKAIEETGKALASLLPQGFRDHAESALNESRQGFEVLFDGVIDSVESGLDKLRPKPKDEAAKSKPRGRAKSQAGKDKVKVDVE